MSPSRRRRAVDHVVDRLRVSERRACAVLRQPRSTQRHRVILRDDEAALTRDIVELASSYGRYGYRRITAMPRVAFMIDAQICRSGFPAGRWSCCDSHSSRRAAWRAYRRAQDGQAPRRRKR